MSDVQLKPRYPNQRIRSLASLSAALGVPESTIVAISNTASSQYRLAKPIVKPDGSIRQPIDALPELKRIQGKIQVNLLRQIEYPPYLTGSLPGTSPYKNASLHKAPAVVISEDIARFFPTTRAELVKGVWAGLFGFSEDVADILTALTTKDGYLPEGARTSSYLANLVFWDCEPRLVSQLAELGATYSRYVDDVTISAGRTLTCAEISRCMALVHSMFGSRGYKANRKKHEIVRANAQMRVTKLVVNSHPSLSKDERKAIRAAVFQLERMVNSGNPWSTNAEALMNSVAGRVSRLGQFHPTIAAPLKARIEIVREGVGRLRHGSSPASHRGGTASTDRVQ